MRYDIRFSGSGGQGIITAGILLAQAAAIKGGKNAVQSQSYGPEARGGASKAEVIISDDEINYPKIVNPDIVISLTQEAYNKYAVDLKDDAVVIVDASMVHEYDNTKYLLDVIIDNFPARAAENNKKAYNIGIELAKKALGE